jgi:hypothetical protein
LVRQYAAALVVFITAVSLWGGYNYYRMGKFIPSKSNLWHELYLANYHDAYGITSSGTFHIHHLGGDAGYQQLYLRVGEVKAM